MAISKSYLITGASGFIGSILLRKLVQKKIKKNIILRKQSNTWRINDLLDKTEIHYSDLSNVNQLITTIKKIKPQIVYHLATNGAYSDQKNANQIIQTNIMGTWNLLQACNKTNYELFVNTGSSSEYGFKKYAMRETDTLKPASYYAVTKCTQTLLCSHIAKQENRPIVTIRPFSVYGPYENPNRLFPTLLKSLLFGKEMDLVSPSIVRDQIYVDDIINAYLKISRLKKYPGEIFNIGTGVQSTIKQVVNAATKITGKMIKFNWGKMKSRSWDTNVWVADISKARTLLRWKPKITLEEGIRKNWNWFIKNQHFYK